MTNYKAEKEMLKVIVPLRDDPIIPRRWKN